MGTGSTECPNLRAGSTSSPRSLKDSLWGSRSRTRPGAASSHSRTASRSAGRSHRIHHIPIHTLRTSSPLRSPSSRQDMSLCNLVRKDKRRRTFDRKPSIFWGRSSTPSKGTHSRSRRPLCCPFQEGKTMSTSCCRGKERPQKSYRLYIRQAFHTTGRSNRRGGNAALTDKFRSGIDQRTRRPCASCNHQHIRCTMTCLLRHHYLRKFCSLQRILNRSD